MSAAFSRLATQGHALRGHALLGSGYRSLTAQPAALSSFNVAHRALNTSVPALARGGSLPQTQRKKAGVAKSKEQREKEAERKANLRLRAQADKAKAKAKKEAEKEKALAAKEKAKLKKAADKQKAREEKLKRKSKPWELYDEQGKKVPMPTERKPRRTTPFILFVQERAPAMKNDPEMNSGTGFLTSFIRRTGEEWKSLSADQKSKYTDMAERHREQYLKDLAAWEASLTDVDRKRLQAYNRHIRSQADQGGKKMNAISVPRDPSKPRRPLSSFMRFYVDYRNSGDADLNDGAVGLAKQAGERWKAMSSSEKQPYEQAFQRDKEEYQRLERQAQL